MKVSVGDAAIQIVTMPGHTPGTLSYLFEIRDNGKPLRVAYVGGTAIPFNGTAAYYDHTSRPRQNSRKRPQNTARRFSCRTTPNSTTATTRHIPPRAKTPEKRIRSMSGGMASRGISRRAELHDGGEAAGSGNSSLNLKSRQSYAVRRFA